jgi:hypothetical protein
MLKQKSYGVKEEVTASSLFFPFIFCFQSIYTLKIKS